MVTFILRCMKNFVIRSDNKYFATYFSTMKNPIVTIKEGQLCGAVDTLYNGSNYYSFKGIPYANPPLGKLRFQAPLTLKPWKGIYNAIEHGPICPQIDMQGLVLHAGDENCLHLNVYTRSLQSDAKTPVMVYFHGGGFMSGSGNSDIYGPRFLLPYDIVLVTVNYRLGLLGFLCLDTPEVPGNAGMKDQVAALQWIQRNIANFGGDPDNVVLFGESAGAASLTYHILSPMSKGLFHKAIAQSGVCTIDWALAKGNRARAFRAGKLLGIDTDNVDDLLTYLVNAPAIDLAALSMKTGTRDERHRGLPIHFAPVVEKVFDGIEPFLIEEPLKLLQTGQFNKVPLIIGYNSAEALFLSRKNLKKLDFYNKYPSFFVPRDIAERISEQKLSQFGERIKRFYFGKCINSNDVEKMCELQSDLHFVVAAHRFASHYAMCCKSVFMYRFNCDTELNFMKIILNLNQYKGACHVDELFYIFDSMTNKELYQSEEKIKILIEKITKLWTDFAKTGNPTPDDSFETRWPPYTPGGKEYLNIEPKLSPGAAAEASRVDFWNELYTEAGLSSVPKSNL